jgi:hypothetical protein
MKEQTFIQKGKKGGTKKRGPTSNQETTSKNANPPMGAAKESSKDLLEGSKITTLQPMLGGYGISVQNQVGYQPVLSLKTRWVPL